MGPAPSACEPSVFDTVAYRLDRARWRAERRERLGYGAPRVALPASAHPLMRPKPPDVHRGRHRSRYTSEQRREIAGLAVRDGLSVTALAESVNRATLYEWVRQLRAGILP